MPILTLAVSEALLSHEAAAFHQTVRQVTVTKQPTRIEPVILSEEEECFKETARFAVRHLLVAAEVDWMGMTAAGKSQ